MACQCRLSANWDLGFDFTGGNCYLVEDGYPIWLIRVVKINTVMWQSMLGLQMKQVL